MSRIGLFWRVSDTLSYAWINITVYNMVVSKHQQEGVECGSIYVNGVIWPSATHGTNATKGEVVYCFWCTGVLVYH